MRPRIVILGCLLICFVGGLVICCRPLILLRCSWGTGLWLAPCCGHRDRPCFCHFLWIFIKNLRLVSIWSYLELVVQWPLLAILRSPSLLGGFIWSSWAILQIFKDCWWGTISTIIDWLFDLIFQRGRVRNLWMPPLIKNDWYCSHNAVVIQVQFSLSTFPFILLQYFSKDLHG